jgi:putative transcriptional regulator
MKATETLRNTLKVQRAMRDLTQADLAARAGVTRRSVNAIETGRMVPSVLLGLKLARALGVTIDELFRLDGEPAEWKLTEPGAERT